jgi:uncharacterized membrane protein YedE/YeeE
MNVAITFSRSPEKMARRAKRVQLIPSPARTLRKYIVLEYAVTLLGTLAAAVVLTWRLFPLAWQPPDLEVSVGQAWLFLLVGPLIVAAAAALSWLTARLLLKRRIDRALDVLLATKLAAYTPTESCSHEPLPQRIPQPQPAERQVLEMASSLARY